MAQRIIPDPKPYFMKQTLGIICITLFVSCTSEVDTKYKNWQVYGGTKEGIRYSTNDEIDTTNVHQLKIAWIYRTGDADTVHHSQIQCNPLIIDSVLYGTTPQMKLFALDAATGKEKWVFNPFDSLTADKRMFFVLNNCRGVTYWDSGDDKRIFYTAGSHIYSVNATSGKLVTSFGDRGMVDLHVPLEKEYQDLFITATSPGIIFKDLLIMGSRVSEGADAAPGFVCAFDVRTGKVRWKFNTIPRPGEFGYETWKDPNAYKFIGGANSWAGFTLDEKRGILFAPTGSASFDFYGGKRKGPNLFANCILALEAATGQLIWHFQNIHHDIWDYDLPTAPALVTIKRNGKVIDAVAQPTKTGFVFVFERETGKPIFPVEEKTVPVNSELAGEELSPTQPIPTLPKPFIRQSFTEKDINNLISDTSYQDIKNRLKNYKTGTMFNPQSLQGTIIFPGLDGGAEWGGPAFDPGTGIIYINANEMPWIFTMVPAKNQQQKKESYLQTGKRLYSKHCMSCHGPERLGSGSFPSLVNIKKTYNEIQLSQIISTGRRMMPGIQLNDEEKSAISTYLLDQKNKFTKTFTHIEDPSDTIRSLPYSITGYNKFLSKDGYPAITPPWGTLNAIDLNTGNNVWKITLGEYPALKSKGIPPTGTENYGGPVVTSTGLLFIAATSDSKFRAFDKRNGKLLWETDLPFPGFATPAVYSQNGKQFIVIACGGGKLGTPSGDVYVAYALPNKD